MPWTKEEKIFCVTTYLETKSFKTVEAKYRRKFNLNNYPQKSQIYRWTHKFQATGSVNNLNKKSVTPRPGRKLTARCPYNVNAVRDSVARSPKKSIRRRSVPAAQRWSFGTCALIKLSFKLETSNLQFLLLSYLLPGNVIIFGVTGLSNKLPVCIWVVACIVRHPVH